jgi:hypothetical protein
MATHNLLNKRLSSLDKKIMLVVYSVTYKRLSTVSTTMYSWQKMQIYGILGIAIKLMRSYLENRYQRVSMKDIKLNKVSSKWEPVKHGVPQGSILGPLLFLIYINDFPLSIKKLANPILFADDTSIIISNMNLEEFKSNISLVLNKTITWFNRNFH